MEPKKKDFTREKMWKLPLKLISSLGLAVVLLIYLVVLTLLGTLNQMEDGLYDSVSKYFSGFFFHDTLFGVPLFLPGAYFILTILFFNILVGTAMKIRRNLKNLALYGVHFGILFLLLAGFVEERFKTEGNMTLYPGMESNEYVSYHHWQLEVISVGEDGTAEEALVIPAEHFKDASEDTPRTFWREDMPFEIIVDRYSRNSLALPAGIPITANSGEKAIDGWVLLERNPELESEANMPGIHARFVPKTGDVSEAIIWAHVSIPMGDHFMDPTPHTVEVGGKKYAVQLVRERFKVPFYVRLDEFELETHPGTTRAKKFQSDVTRLEEGRPDQQIEIRMNEPLREDGVVFFQSKYGPTEPRPGEDYYSVFAVVDNPSDQWPFYALIWIQFSLVAHFIVRLTLFIMKSPSSRSKGATPASA